MKATTKRIIIIAAILIALVLIWFFFIHKKEAPVTVVAEKPTTGYIAQSVTATGKIEPVDTVTVGTQISGILQYLYVDFNSKVKKGELLASLDKSLLQATLDQNKGQLQSAQSQLVFAKNNFNRQDLLFKTDAISKADYDSALNTLDEAKANVASAQAQVRSAQKNLSYADIYSPIDGVILNRSVSIGQTVAASFSTPTLFIIAKDITKMEVEANVDEADIGDVIPGNRASFTVDAFINDQFGGKVTEIRLHPTVSANVVTYTTIINAPNDDMKLKPGMTANIVIYTKEVNNAMLIPAKALSFTPDSSLLSKYQIEGHVSHKGVHKGAAGTGSTTANEVSHTAKSRADTGVTKQKALIWVLQGTRLIQKRIEIGLNDNTHVEVLSGLTADDLIATGISGGNTGVVAATPGSSPFLPKRTGGGGKSK
ncbi:efflux RND transporter periplasmic adaptor subunit [Mucilaginibacter sp. X4EP1]|uniref:efflux RND transporter periplasmic adaptor subunit n=1 Tax=Mucilaginibacter sp. X4EP1 TaxID=2723092 RepID=UPI002169AF47|nr:efflux RND transporter periplasmic adaptor subunit [Mucilaginibacter sp. X4EP1]MCS3814828.1 HlyD family secretion protein [Mucilaginibacter sp. X4EP1]